MLCASLYWVRAGTYQVSHLERRVVDTTCGLLIIKSCVCVCVCVGGGAL